MPCEFVLIIIVSAFYFYMMCFALFSPRRVPSEPDLSRVGHTAIVSCLTTTVRRSCNPQAPAASAADVFIQRLHSALL